MAVEDADVRGACIDAAQRQPEDQPAGETDPATARESGPAPELQEQAFPARREQGRKTPAADASRLREPAERFAGEITRIHQSILDRQLIALDNSYLFVSDRARLARFKVGQTVEVRKVKQRFGSGRTWRITGPSRHPIDAFRIRCESDYIGADDRRRCEQMLDR